MDALMNQCDAKDGVTDGMISDPLGCNLDPAVLACKNGRSDGCIPPAKLSAIKKAFAGPKNSYGTQVYPGFLYDVGIAETGPVPGLLALGPKGLFGPYPIATELDVDKEAMHASDPLVEPASTNLSTFSANGGKLLFFHGDSDPWFSPLDTLEYYRSLANGNGGGDKVAGWSRMFLVPGMGHCGSGPALDQFDMLSAVVRIRSSPQERHFPAGAGPFAHIPSTPSTQAKAIPTTLVTSAANRRTAGDHRAPDASCSHAVHSPRFSSVLGSRAGGIGFWVGW
jgi:hypothetical protein